MEKSIVGREKEKAGLKEYMHSSMKAVFPEIGQRPFAYSL